MQKRQNNRLNMYLAVKLIIAKNILKWTGYLPFENANTKFNSLVDLIMGVNEIQKIKIEGYTVEKREKKMVMARLGAALAQKIKAYAADTNKPGLYGEMKISFTELFHMRAAASLAYGKQVLGNLNEMSAADRTLYNITAADVTAYTDAVSAFDNAIALPREKTTERKTQTKRLAPIFKETTKLLNERLDNLMAEFVVTEPVFYNDYKNARIIVDAIRHTVIKANVHTAEGEDLKRVKVTLTGKDKVTQEVKAVFEELTDSDGNMIKSALNPEYEWDLKFELPAFEPVEIRDVDLAPGEFEEMEVVLKRV